MPDIGVPELIIILLIVIVIFGAGKLPQLGKGLGEGIKNFKDAVKDGTSGGSSKPSSPSPDNEEKKA